MTRPAADLVKVAWTGTGNGTPITLGAALTGFAPFPSTANARYVPYSIEVPGSTEKETGYGVYTNIGTTLTREFITFSTVGAPTRQNFGVGNKVVRLTVLAPDVVENFDTVDPGPSNDITQNYLMGRARWLNTTNGTLWYCTNHAVGAAVWNPVENLSGYNPVNY